MQASRWYLRNACSLFAVDHFCLILILMTVCCALSLSISTSLAICVVLEKKTDCVRSEDMELGLNPSEDPEI